MRPEAGPIQFTNGRVRSYGKNKVDIFKHVHKDNFAFSSSHKNDVDHYFPAYTVLIKQGYCLHWKCQFRVYHPKSYCTILFSSVIRAGRPTSNGIWFKMFSGLLKLIIHDYLGQWFSTPSDALSSVHGALSLLGEVLVFEKGQLNQLSQWPKSWGPTALQILYVFLI